jgi:hypothetical protein
VICGQYTDWATPAAAIYKGVLEWGGGEKMQLADFRDVCVYTLSSNERHAYKTQFSKTVHQVRQVC